MKHDDRNLLEDDVLDAIIRQSVKEIVEEEAEEIFERYGEESTNIVESSTFEERMDRVLHPHRKRKFRLRVLLIAAILTILLYATLTFSVSAFRERLFNFFTGTSEPTHAIARSQDNYAPYLSAMSELGWDNLYVPAMAPYAGMTPEIVIDEDSSSLYANYNFDEGYLYFFQSKQILDSLGVDQERGSVQEIEMMGEPAFLRESDDDTCITWNHEDIAFVITTNHDETVAIKFAESLLRIGS